MKKLLSILMATMVLLAMQVGAVTPAYAGTYEATHKIDGHLLYGNYTYNNVHLENGKLIANGDWRTLASYAGCTIAFQVVQPISYDGYTFNSDGTVNLGVLKDGGIVWTLSKDVSVVPVVRSATCAAAQSVSFTVDISGIPDGLYELQELTTKGSHQEGSITDDLFLVVYNGVPSIQNSAYPNSQFAGFWSNDHIYIGAGLDFSAYYASLGN